MQNLKEKNNTKSTPFPLRKAIYTHDSFGLSYTLRRTSMSFPPHCDLLHILHITGVWGNSCRREQLKSAMFEGPSWPLSGQVAVRIAFLYPSTLLSFYKKENDFRCYGSLGREGVQTHQGWAGHSAESSVNSQACTVHTTVLAVIPSNGVYLACTYNQGWAR